MIKICIGCGKEYETKSGRQKYCTATCRKLATSERQHEIYVKRNPPGRKISTCAHCGEEFFYGQRHRKFCTPDCRRKAYLKKLEARNMRFRTQTNQQPCWNCKKYAGGCSWSRSFKPIPGWDAKKVIREEGNVGYDIKYCPEFEEG